MSGDLKVHGNRPAGGAPRKERQDTPLQKLALSTWTFQVMSALLTFNSANNNHQSILYTGLVLSASGYAFALVTWPLRSSSALALGLSAPIVTAVTHGILVVFPRDRSGIEELLSIMLLVYIVIAMPLAAVAWRQILAPRLRRSQWQYSVSSLLVLMTFIALALVAIRVLAETNNGAEFELFVGFILANVTLCAIVVCWFAISSPKVIVPDA